MPQPNMPANQDVQVPGEGGDVQNPVIDALKTIQTWIASVQQKDPQKAQTLTSAFTQFISTLGGGGGAPPEAANPEPPQAQKEQPPMDNKTSAIKPGSRPISMHAKPGAVPIM